MLITGNLKIYRGVGVSSTFLAVMRCSYQFFFAVLRYSEPPNAPLITAEEKINSAFEAIKTQFKITGLPPEKRGQVIKSSSSEKNVFAVTGENKNIICETGGKGTSARARIQFGAASQALLTEVGITSLTQATFNTEMSVFLPFSMFRLVEPLPFLYTFSLNRYPLDGASPHSSLKRVPPPPPGGGGYKSMFYKSHCQQ